MEMNEDLLQEDVVATATQQEGLMDSVKEYLNPKNWAEKFNLSRQKVFELALYFGAGFILGFLVKKYSKLLIAAGIIIGIMMILNYLGLICVTVCVDRVQSMFGITLPLLRAETFAHYLEWIKVNIAQVVTFSVGFVIGLKVA